MKQLVLTVILALSSAAAIANEVLSNTKILASDHQSQSYELMWEQLLQADHIVIAAEPQIIQCSVSAESSCHAHSQRNWQQDLLNTLISRLSREQWLKHFVDGMTLINEESTQKLAKTNRRARTLEDVDALDAPVAFQSHLPRDLFIELFRTGVDFRPGLNEFRPDIPGTWHLKGFDYLRNAEVQKAKNEDFEKYYGTEEQKRARMSHLQSVLKSAFHPMMELLKKCHAGSGNPLWSRFFNSHCEKSEGAAWQAREPGSLVFLTTWEHAHSERGVAPYIHRFANNFLREPKVVVIRLSFAHNADSVGMEGLDFLLIEESGAE